MRRGLRRALFVLTIFVLIALYRYRRANGDAPSAIHTSESGRGHWRDLSLTTQQCKSEFPGLEKEIENAVAEGGFVLKKAADNVPGSIQGRIRDGKVIYLFSDDFAARWC